MRHGKKFNHLSRRTGHRKSLLTNQAKSLLQHKRIFTTVAKAKALRKFVEPIITKCKKDTTHSRRIVFSYFQDKEPVKILFNDIAHTIGDRPGGYTRIIKIGNRLGDNAATCMIELVDYNTSYNPKKASGTTQGKSKTRRSKGKAKTDDLNEVAIDNQDTLILEDRAAQPEQNADTTSSATDVIPNTPSENDTTIPKEDDTKPAG